MDSILFSAILIILIVLVIILLIDRRRVSKPNIPKEPIGPSKEELEKLQEELKQRLEAVQEKEEELSDRLVYENYVEGRFSHLLAIAIQGVVKENSATVSAVEKALGPRNNYRQSTAYLDHMLDAGVVVEDPYHNRKIAITPGQSRCIIVPRLMNYPAEWGVSQVVEQLRHDVIVMLADFWTEVDTMSGTEFEEWCKKLLEALGYINVNLTKATGDQGVDITAEKDEIPFAFQCKCWASDLGNTPVQEVYAGLRYYNCCVGVVITNRHFTKGAKDLAKANNVILWDRDTLKRLIKQIRKDARV